MATFSICDVQHCESPRKKCAMMRSFCLASCKQMVEASKLGVFEGFSVFCAVLPLRRVVFDGSFFMRKGYLPIPDSVASHLFGD